MTVSRPYTLDNIQVLRALAATNVVLYHIIGGSLARGRSVGIFGPLEGWGQCGVDAFFVISGFVMVVSQAARPRPAVTFVVNRLVRIVPTYWAATLIVGLLQWLSPLGLHSVAPTPGALFASLAFVSQLGFGQSPVLFVGWTLEYEMLFYLLFAIAIALLRRHRGLALGFVPVAVAMAMPLTGGMILEFLMGVVVGLCFPLARSRAVSLSAAIVGGGLLMVSIYLRPGIPRIWLWGLPALLLVTGAASLPPLRSALGRRLGDASYSIYLWQVALVPAYFLCVAHGFVPLPPTLQVVVGTAAVVAVGFVLYLALEAPAVQACKRWARRHAAPG